VGTWCDISNQRYHTEPDIQTYEISLKGQNPTFSVKIIAHILHNLLISVSISVSVSIHLSMSDFIFIKHDHECEHEHEFGLDQGHRQEDI
jgi:hypothetical protein